jgi:hypothetical protein
LKRIETSTADLGKITKRLDALEVKANRPGAGEKKSDDEQAQLERKSFTTFLRMGREALGADEVKSLRCTSRLYIIRFRDRSASYRQANGSLGRRKRDSPRHRVRLRAGCDSDR